MNRHFISIIVLLGLISLLVIGAELIDIRLITRIATHLCITLILVLGLQVYMGNSGILSFAHIGFMGIGAYASAVLTIPSQMRGMALPELYPVIANVEISPIAGILIGGLLAATLAAIISYPLMRLSDAAAVITSFALLVVLHTIMLHWSAVTNGPRTLFGIPAFTNLTIAAVFSGIAVVIALAFKESNTGLLLRASRDDEIAADAIGVNIPKIRWIAFILSALLAGIGGALWGHFITSFSPKAFFLKETFVVLGMLVIGGPSTITGAVVGTFVVLISFEGLRAAEGALNQTGYFSGQVIGLTEIVLAVAMIIILILRPGGLIATREIGDSIVRIWKKRRLR
jgi:branched-chain amino acid transport system permease protein